MALTVEGWIGPDRLAVLRDGVRVGEVVRREEVVEDDRPQWGGYRPVRDFRFEVTLPSGVVVRGGGRSLGTLVRNMERRCEAAGGWS